MKTETFLDGAWPSGDDCLPIGVILGTAGCGKTSAAVEIAYRAASSGVPVTFVGRDIPDPALFPLSHPGITRINLPVMEPLAYASIRAADILKPESGLIVCDESEILKPPRLMALMNGCQISRRKLVLVSFDGINLGDSLIKHCAWVATGRIVMCRPPALQPLRIRNDQWQAIQQLRRGEFMQFLHNGRTTVVATERDTVGRIHAIAA